MYHLQYTSFLWSQFLSLCQSIDNWLVILLCAGKCLQISTFVRHKVYFRFLSVKGSSLSTNQLFINNFLYLQHQHKHSKEFWFLYKFIFWIKFDTFNISFWFNFIFEPVKESITHIFYCQLPFFPFLPYKTIKLSVDTENINWLQYYQNDLAQSRTSSSNHRCF